MRVFAKYKLKRWTALILSMLLAFEPVAIAQTDESAIPPPTNVPTQAQHAFSQQELDQMLAPIALYPDPLLSQILMASTYPLEVVEAARWSRANPYLKDEDAVRATQQRDWDPSVKSLVAFPQILQMMDEKLDWTERLGDAFLVQETQAMDTVQNLRQKAYANGNLRSNDQIKVNPDGQIIVVEPANPEIVYVPYYNPTVVYGPWWWDDYPPIYWAPWPGYYYESGFAWGFGIVITTGFFFGDCDWHHHRVNVVNVNSYYYIRTVHDEGHPERNVNHAPGAWQHDPDHRRGVPYRDASLRQQYNQGSTTPGTRREFHGGDRPSFSDHGQSGNRQIERGNAIVVPDVPADRHGDHGAIPDTRAAKIHSGEGVGTERRSYERGDQTHSRNVPKGESHHPGEVRPHASENSGHGTNVRNPSSHGRASSEGTARNQSSIPVQRTPDNATGQHSR